MTHLINQPHTHRLICQSCNVHTNIQIFTHLLALWCWCPNLNHLLRVQAASGIPHWLGFCCSRVAFGDTIRAKPDTSVYVRACCRSHQHQMISSRLKVYLFSSSQTGSWIFTRVIASRHRLYGKEKLSIAQRVHHIITAHRLPRQLLQLSANQTVHYVRRSTEEKSSQWDYSNSKWRKK